MAKKYLDFNLHTELDVPVESGTSVDGTVEKTSKRKLSISQNQLKGSISLFFTISPTSSQKVNID